MIAPPDKPNPAFKAWHDKFMMMKFFRVAESVNDECQLLTFRRYCQLTKNRAALPFTESYIDKVYADVRDRVFPVRNTAYRSSDRMNKIQLFSS